MVIDDILSDVGVGGTAGDDHSSSSVIVIDVGECRSEKYGDTNDVQYSSSRGRPLHYSRRVSCIR